MRRILLAVAAVALGACADAASSPIEPGPAQFASGDRWSIFFDDETPAQTLDASPGWEVATRFYATTAGCIRQLHFYRASGETGTNYVKVWTNSGTLLYSNKIADSGSGWRTLFLQGVGPPIDNSICISANTYYRVSVNTNTKQGKTLGYFDSGAVTSGALVADWSYYGQPTGSFPTTGSGSAYFVDVTFEED